MSELFQYPSVLPSLVQMTYPMQVNKYRKICQWPDVRALAVHVCSGSLVLLFIYLFNSRDETSLRDMYDTYLKQSKQREIEPAAGPRPVSYNK